MLSANYHTDEQIRRRAEYNQQYQGSYDRPLYRGDVYGYNRETFSQRIDANGQTFYNNGRPSLSNQIIHEEPMADEEDPEEAIRIDLSE